MATVEQQVEAASDAIDRNIAAIKDDRGFLSQNLLQYLRDLVEGLIVWSCQAPGLVEGWLSGVGGFEGGF